MKRPLDASAIFVFVLAILVGVAGAVLHNMPLGILSLLASACGFMLLLTDMYISRRNRDRLR